MWWKRKKLEKPETVRKISVPYGDLVTILALAEMETMRDILSKDENTRRYHEVDLRTVLRVRKEMNDELLGIRS